MRSFVQSRNTLRIPLPRCIMRASFCAHLPSRRLYAACSEFDEAKLFQASATVFSKILFRRFAPHFFADIWRSRIAPPFTLSTFGGMRGHAVFLRCNYNRRKAKATLLLLTPRSSRKNATTVRAPPSQPVKGFRRQYAPHFYRQIAQEGTPRLSKRFFVDNHVHITQLPRLKTYGRMSPPYAAIPPYFSALPDDCFHDNMLGFMLFLLNCVEIYIFVKEFT